MPALTDDAWAQIRQAYEHSDRPVADICAEHGISTTTLRDRMRRWRWTRRRPPISREGPAAMAAMTLAASEARREPGWSEIQTQTNHPTPPVLANARTVDPPPSGEGEASDPASIAPRLQGAVARVLPAIEAIIARLAAGPMPPREIEQTARALGTLTRTLRELNALLAQQQPRAADDDMPQDMDAFRDELARRIEAFVASRSDETFEVPPAAATPAES